MTLEDLVRMLQMRGGFEVVNHQAAPNQLRLLGRVRNPSMDAWILVVNQLKSVEESAPWSIDISKQYFRRGGKLMFAWRVILQAENVEQCYAHVAQSVSNSPRARTIIEEQPLPGARSDRNAPSVANRGKGAQSALKSTVGPWALAALQQQQGN